MLHLLGVFDVGGGNGRHTYDTVHGRADIVAHIGEKFAFGLVCLLGGPAGGIQSTELLFRQPEIAQEYQKQRAQNKQAAA